MILGEPNLKDQKYINLQDRWSRTENLLNLQQQERKESATCYSQNLQKKINLITNLQKSKAQVIANNFRQIGNQINDCKENIDRMHDFQATSKENIQRKRDCFFEKYVAQSNVFQTVLKNYGLATTNEIEEKIKTVNEESSKIIQQQMKQFKRNKQQVACFMNDEKQRLQMGFKQLNGEVEKNINELKQKMKQSARKRNDSNSKIKEMINNLNRELNSALMQESQQGDVTYDSLLKLIEDSCSIIQANQFKQ